MSLSRFQSILFPILFFSASASAERNLIGVYDYDSVAVNHLCPGGGSKNGGPNFFCNSNTDLLRSWTLPALGLTRLDMVKAQINYYDAKIAGYGPEYALRYLRWVGTEDWMSKFHVRNLELKEANGYTYTNLNSHSTALLESLTRVAFSPLIEADTASGFQNADIQYAYTTGLGVMNNGGDVSSGLEYVHNSFAMATSAMINDHAARTSYYTCGKFNPSNPNQDVVFHLNLLNGKWKRGSYDANARTFTGRATTHIGSWTPFPTVPWKDFQKFTLGNSSMDSVMARDGSTGNWWTATGTATGVQNQWLGTWSNNVNWVNLMVGDFFGDSRKDFVGMIPTSGYGHVNGQVYGAVATTGAGNYQTFNNVLAVQFPPELSNPVGYYVADLIGEGKKGIVVLSEYSYSLPFSCVYPDGSSHTCFRPVVGEQVWYMRPNATRTGFTPVYLASIEPNGGYQQGGPNDSIVKFMIGKDSTGKESLLYRETLSGILKQLKLNAAGNPVISNVGTFSTATTYTDMQTYDLNGDGNSDILARDAMSGNFVAAYSNAANTSYTLAPLAVSWNPQQNLSMIGVCKLDGQTPFIVGRTGAGECYGSPVNGTSTYDLGTCNGN